MVLGLIVLLVSSACWWWLWSQLPGGICHCRRWGCQCGKKRQKAETRADDLATQARQFVSQAALRTGEESDLLARLLGRSQQTGGQLFRDLDPTAAAYSDIVGRRLGLTGGQLFGEISPAATELQSQTNALLQNPYLNYQSTFGEQIGLLQDQINREANKRGILGGGVPIEQLGRAGGELAIREGAVKQGLVEQALNRAAGLVEAEESLSSGARGEAGALSEFEAGLLQEALSNYGNTLSSIRGREATGAAQAQSLANPFFQSSLGFLAQREQASAERDAAIAKALGSALGTAGGFLVGGPVGASIGSQLGGSLGGAFGGGSGGSSGGSLGGFGSLFGGSSSVPTTYGSPGYHGAGYANYPQLYQQLYGPSSLSLYGR